VAIRDDVVVKIQDPAMGRRERMRTLAGQAVGKATGLFVVPEIVTFDDGRGEIVFERLPVVPLLQAPTEHSRNLDLVGRAAAVLAAIHMHLEAEELVSVAPGAGTAALERRHVALHGDFGVRNVLYMPESDRLAVIDWANAEWMALDSDIGVPETDVAVFLMSLFHRRVLNAWPVAHRYEAASRFLATYAAASPHGLDVATLAAVVARTMPGFNRLMRREKGTFRALGFRHGMIDLKFFLRRLSHAGFPERAADGSSVNRD
jgi:hypothetical protein